MVNIQIKQWLPVAVCGSVLLLVGCGSDDSDKEYRGYMPRFAGDILTSGPARPLRSILLVDKEDQESDDDSPMQGKRVAAAPLQQTAIVEDAEESEVESIEFERIDCSKAGDVWNAAPQAADFNNSALQFIQNLQAQTVFYDCIIRAQVFNHSASVSEAETISTVVTSFEEGENSYFASWTLPSAVVSENTSRELQIDSQGILVNLQPGIDTSKTRVDLNQTVDGTVFRKHIRSTLQDRLLQGTNIRSVSLYEVKDSAGVVQEQRITGRITFGNNISVVAALIQPGAGAISYLKQCEDNQQTDDYLRACNNDWSEQVYDNQWNLISDTNQIAQLKAQLQLNGDDGTAVAAEQLFYNGESEAEFFQKRTLPEASE
jgi:hypothetical protein